MLARTLAVNGTMNRMAGLPNGLPNPAAAHDTATQNNVIVSMGARWGISV